MDVRTLWLPKRGSLPEEYEDAFAADPDAGLFAVADGATESSFARPWAQLLVNEFVRSRDRLRNGWRGLLPPLQTRWVAEVSAEPIPWFAEPKFEHGAFATFLGLFVERAGRRRWRSVAVGDSCLFQVRGAKLVAKFPVQYSADFGSTPGLVGSRTPADKIVHNGEVRCRGKWEIGDQFWLLTDALAKWFLQQVEAKARPWERLDAILNGPHHEAAFTAWIEGLRTQHDIRNDDVTCLVVNPLE